MLYYNLEKKYLEHIRLLRAWIELSSYKSVSIIFIYIIFKVILWLFEISFFNQFWSIYELEMLLWT